MISKIRWLWKQFTGPRISAFCVGIYRAIFNAFDSTLTYLNSFSLATARAEHTTLIGMMMGIARTTMSVPNQAHFLFTYQPEVDLEHGFSEVNGAVGGIFTDPNDPESEYTFLRIPASMYRPILEATLNSEGVVGSLIWIEDVLDAIVNENVCTLEWMENEPGIYYAGCLNIVIGQETQVGGEYLVKIAALRAIINEAVQPDTVAYINFAGG